MHPHPSTYPRLVYCPLLSVRPHVHSETHHVNALNPPFVLSESRFLSIVFNPPSIIGWIVLLLIIVHTQSDVILIIHMWSPSRNGWIGETVFKSVASTLIPSIGFKTSTNINNNSVLSISKKTHLKDVSRYLIEANVLVVVVVHNWAVAEKWRCSWVIGMRLSRTTVWAFPERWSSENGKCVPWRLMVREMFREKATRLLADWRNGIVV